MTQKIFTLHVPTSEDGRTTFSEVADILDHLATMYGWHPDVHGFLVTRATEARMIDSTYDFESDCTTIRNKMVADAAEGDPGEQNEPRS